MYRVQKDFTDGLTKEKHKVGDIIDVAPGRVIALSGFIKPIKDKIEPEIEPEIETEMIDSGITEKAILRKPKRKAGKIIS